MNFQSECFLAVCSGELGDSSEDEILDVIYTAFKGGACIAMTLREADVAQCSTCTPQFGRVCRNHAVSQNMQLHQEASSTYRAAPQ